MTIPWIQIAGNLGGFLFVSACVPMAIQTVRQGKAVVTDRSTIWTFVAACALFSVYLIGTTGWRNPPALFLSAEFFAWALVAWYSYFPRKPDYDRVCGGIPISLDGHCMRESGHDGPCIAPYDMKAVAEDILSVNRMQEPGDDSPVIDECTREPGHEGPCNGWPSQDCNVWCASLGRALPLREHPCGAAEHYKRMSD